MLRIKYSNTTDKLLSTARNRFIVCKRINTPKGANPTALTCERLKSTKKSYNQIADSLT